MSKKYDFSGWATKNNLQCSDGRIITQDAFKHNDGLTVPLVWNHQHAEAVNILGHAMLENRPEGVYAYGRFNETPAGQNAKILVDNGDITSLSIYANKLKQNGNYVQHGVIREVSLVLAGANPGAYIDSIIKHGEESEDEGIIYTGETLQHSYQHEINNESKNKEEDVTMNEDQNLQHADEGKTVQEIFNTLSEEQKNVVYALIGQAVEDAKNENIEHGEGEGEDMKHNLFENDNNTGVNVISHAEMTAVINDAKRYGSLKEAAMQHGIDDIEFLFPEAQTLNKTPDFIQRDQGWVGTVFSGVHNTPFSRIKSLHADITGDEARALGYMKGNLKKDEVFSLLKRTTDPQTIYKKQKLHRDDVIDITDFDVVAWLKAEMRMMLNEEIARAVLVGDGRLGSSDDKIDETHIRPIWTDAELYTINHTLELSTADAADADKKAKAFIRGCIKARKEYKGSGNPKLFTTEDVLTDCLLVEDGMGRRIYESQSSLATALRVSEIVTVPVMEGLKRTVDTKERNLMGIIVNLTDYNIGADKGGAVAMFDDFDIDYNAQKYLIETRCSGALTKPFSAIAVEYTVK